MRKQELDLSLSLYLCFTAVFTTAVGQDKVYCNVRDTPLSDTSLFSFSCDAGKIIIVNSATVGATYRVAPPQRCPITSNTCLKEITIAADLCTGRNTCIINQNVLNTDEWSLLCSLIGILSDYFINIYYTCIVPEVTTYGDICHFDEDLYSDTTVYISSYPKFPDGMGAIFGYQCSCLLTTSLRLVNVRIKALLVKLTSSYTTCSERLSIIDSNNQTKLQLCSPYNVTNSVTTVPLASDPVVILFQRDSVVSPYNGKFIFEITALSESSESVSTGSMKCSSTIPNSTNVTATSQSYISTTTTSAMLNQSSTFSSINIKNTSLGITLRSSNMSASTQQSILSSSKPASETWNATLSSSIVPSNGTGTPTPASQTVPKKTSISTGDIIGIVLGSVGFIVIVIIVLLCLRRKQKQNRDQSKGNTNFTVRESLTVTQNMQTTDNIDLHEATSSELHTFQSPTHFSDEPQTTDYENYCQTKDNSMFNYEEGAPVSGATYGPGMIQANEQTRLSGNDLTTETQLMNSGDGETTLVENQLYGENEKPMTDVVASSDYDVVRPVVQDGRTDESAEVYRGHVQMKNNSADHSYYNVPGHTGSGTIQSPTEVSAEAETNSVSDEIETTNPMYKADSDVVLIDNTLYGSMLTF